MWNEIEGFLSYLDVVVEELRAKLSAQFAGAGTVEETLGGLGTTLMEDEGAVLLRYFRRGTLSESESERELSEGEKTMSDAALRLEKSSFLPLGLTSSFARSELGL